MTPYIAHRIHVWYINIPVPWICHGYVKHLCFTFVEMVHHGITSLPPRSQCCCRMLPRPVTEGRRQILQMELRTRFEVWEGWLCLKNFLRIQVCHREGITPTFLRMGLEPSDSREGWSCLSYPKQKREVKFDFPSQKCV